MTPRVKIDGRWWKEVDHAEWSANYCETETVALYNLDGSSKRYYILDPNQEPEHKADCICMKCEDANPPSENGGWEEMEDSGKRILEDTKVNFDPSCEYKVMWRKKAEMPDRKLAKELVQFFVVHDYEKAVDTLLAEVEKVKKIMEGKND